MKQVTFKVATALKDAGYPQDLSTYQKCYWSHCDDIRLFNYDEVDCLDYWQLCCVAPTYLEIWLWLEKEKKIIIHPDSSFTENGELKYATITHFIKNSSSIGQDYVYNSSEEAIIAAIEHLVDNDLIK